MHNISQATFFPVGNGDTVLLEAGNTTIVTDIHCRQCAADESDNDCYDFADELRAACKRRNGKHIADILVLTHPDKDHVTGFDTFFHTGPPEKYDPDPEDDDPKILIAELWVSPYAVSATAQSDESKAFLKEVRRRNKLIGTPSANKDGNRIKVLSLDGGETKGSIGNDLSWTLLAPTAAEAKVDKDESCNKSSLVIRWQFRATGKRVLLGGDATVDIWERIWDDYQDRIDLIDWDVLLAPHHCSRYSMGRKDPDNTDRHIYSDKALDALGQMIDCGYVVSSSKKIKRDGDDPPSWSAKQKYLRILEKNDSPDPDERFLNPATHRDGDPAPVVIEFSQAGSKLKVPATRANAAPTIITAAASTPNTYG